MSLNHSDVTTTLTGGQVPGIHSSEATTVNRQATGVRDHPSLRLIPCFTLLLCVKFLHANAEKTVFGI